MLQQTLEDDGLLITEASRSHSVGILWTSEQPDADTFNRQQTLTRDRQPCPWRDSNPQPPASERLQTYTFDRVVTVSAISHDTNHKSFHTNTGHTNSVSTCPCILK
jgi:hypothetical protein